jgi:hypothetical protein
MDRKRVLQALDILNGGLSGAHDVDEEARAALGRVTEDIRRLIAKQEEGAAAGAQNNSGAELSGLKDALLEFEAEHPQLTGAVNHLAAALANLGI